MTAPRILCFKIRMKPFSDPHKDDLIELELDADISQFTAENEVNYYML